MMKKYLFGVSVVALLAVGHAQAADVVQTYEPPALAPAVEIAPAFSWDGFYVGGQIGGSWSDTDVSVGVSNAAGSRGARHSADADGFIGGIYAGYNFDLGNDIVIGLETDFIWGSADESTGTHRFDVSGLGITYTPTGGTIQKINALDYAVGVEQKWAGATRVRVGYAMDRWLPYVSAGVAYAQVKSTGVVQVWGDPTGGGAVGTSYGRSSGRNKDTFTGWTLGAGFDYAATDNILLRLEYRYSDYGDKTYRYSYAAPAGSTSSTGFPVNAGYKVDYKTHDVRVGIAYKF